VQNNYLDFIIPNHGDLTGWAKQDKPPSLINIFKEVQNNYLDFIIPNHGDLTGWAKQGVLLLNACLTVQAHLANSHSNKGWEQFTDAVIKYLNDSFRNRVFLLWGNYAQKKGSFIDQRKHLILKTVHPSPLSASRGFFGCNHFKKANDYLIKNKIDPIDWNKLD
ncbi:uracil DNA glycosylase-like protein, partial [Sarcoptes scabiei]